MAAAHLSSTDGAVVGDVFEVGVGRRVRVMGMPDGVTVCRDLAVITWQRKQQIGMTYD